MLNETRISEARKFSRNWTLPQEESQPFSSTNKANAYLLPKKNYHSKKHFKSFVCRCKFEMICE